MQAWHKGKFKLVVSPEILDEYSRVGEALAERFPALDIRPIFELVTVNAELVSAADAAEPICDDPDDDKFFLCAISAACEVIVSGDRHLLARSGYAGIQVLKPRDFVDNILS